MSLIQILTFIGLMIAIDHQQEKLPTEDGYIDQRTINLNIVINEERAETAPSVYVWPILGFKMINFFYRSLKIV